MVNPATLPGVVSYTLAMPDVYQGYGFPVGGVATAALPAGVISPGAIGYDVNCGVRLLAAELDAAEAPPYLGELADELDRSCPIGTDHGGRLRLSDADLDAVLAEGTSSPGSSRSW